MKLQTVKKVVMAGFTICIFASLIGIFAGAGNPQLSNYMLVAAVIVLLFTLAIIMKWARCPLVRRLAAAKGSSSLRSARTASRNLETGKKKKGPRRQRKEINGAKE